VAQAEGATLRKMKDRGRGRHGSPSPKTPPHYPPGRPLPQRCHSRDSILLNRETAEAGRRADLDGFDYQHGLVRVLPRPCVDDPEAAAAEVAKPLATTHRTTRRRPLWRQSG
jgi:hypothetical protein